MAPSTSIPTTQVPSNSSGTGPVKPTNTNDLLIGLAFIGFVVLVVFYVLFRIYKFVAGKAGRGKKS